MSKPTKKAAKAVKSLLSRATISVISKGRAARYEVAVRATVDCHKAVGDKLSIAVVRKEIKAYDPYYSLSKDVMQTIVNAVKSGNSDITSLVALAEQAQTKGNESKRKSRGKTSKTGDGKTGEGKTGEGKTGEYVDSVLNLPDPSLYGDWGELLADYNHLVNWIAKAEKLLKKEKLIK